MFPTVANGSVLNGVITAQSILMGFAFNVMVYISSQDALRTNLSDYREEKMKAIRLNDLGSVDKGDSQTRQYLIQGGFWGGYCDPGIDERRGMGLS